MQSIYRMELSPPQQQNQANGSPASNSSQNLPLQKPVDPFLQQQQQQQGQYAQTYQMQQPQVKPDLRETFLTQINGKVAEVGQNRFSSKMQERVAEIAGGLRQAVESGQMTQEEARQVLGGAITEEFGVVNKWSQGVPGPSNWREFKDPQYARKFIIENKQSFDELNRLEKEVPELKSKLEKVYDKKDPRYMKALQHLGNITNQRDALKQQLKMGLWGGEAIEGSIKMREARESEGGPHGN